TFDLTVDCKAVTPCASTGAAKATKPLNKKQRMLARLSGDEDSLGHQWVKGAEGSTNMTMKCAICGLYLQQINDLPSFDRLMHHPCKGRGDPLQQWNIHSSHDMINMGVQ
ncbi:pol, partial [Symbiodinium sp. CCMP2592]